MTNREAILRIGEHCRIHFKAEPESIMITEALNMAIKALEQQEKDRWIPVNERFPENTGNCLVTNRWGEVDRAHFYHKAEKWAGYGFGNIQAWKPLPEPYKADEF